MYYDLINQLDSMNILFVNEGPFNPHFGGIERVTDLLVKEFLKFKNIRIYYLAARVDASRMLDYDFPVKQEVLPMPGEFSNTNNVDFYRNYLHDNDIDIVVNQRGWAPFMNNVIGIDGVKTISVIHTVPRGRQLIYMNGILRHDKTFNGYWRYFIKIILYPGYYLYKWLRSYRYLLQHYKVLATKSSAVVLLSNKCKADFQSLLSAVKDTRLCPTLAIPNPTLIDEFSDVNMKENIILYVGRLSSSEKKPIRLLRLWRKLYNRHKDWRLVIVGDGDSYRELSNYIIKYKLPRVFMEGKQENVIPYYKKASFICLTSNLEGWGMSLTEGMTYGCIPMTFNNYGAASDIIDDGINGCLIEPFDLDAYANALSNLINNDQKRFLMSKAAISKAKTFSSSLIANKWIELFHNVSNS